MTKKKDLPIIQASVHTFAITGSIRSKHTKNQIYDAMHTAVYENLYKWSGRNCIVKCGGGMRLTLITALSGNDFILIDDINLPRIAGNSSYLALTDLSPSGLAEQASALEQELSRLGVSLKDDSIRFSLRRLDLTQDFYVKSDPSLRIRNLRLAGETGLYRGIHPNHFTACNEKHSARWRSKWFDINIYDKHAELQSKNQIYHNVPESDLTNSKRRLRYEVSLKREFLKKFEKMIRIQEERDFFSIEMEIQNYFETVAPYIPTILRNIASDLFGDYSWQKLSYVQEEVEFACRVGTIDEKAGELTQNYLRALNSPNEMPGFQLTATSEKTIREVLDQLEINRIIIPERILTKRELVRFPCSVLSAYVQGEGKNIDGLEVPRRPWKQMQRISRPLTKHADSDRQE